MKYTIILKSKLLMFAIPLIAICFAVVYSDRYLQTEAAYGQQPSRIHVSIRSGNNIDGCGSTDMPCRTIQFAINKANSGDEILIAGGTYIYDPTSDVCSDQLGMAVVCILDKKITMKGGYSSDDWFNQNTSLNETVIDGEQAHRGVLVVDTIFATRLDMDGFTIQNGLAKGIAGRSGDNAIFAYGGGMFVERTEEVVLSNIRFESNRSQGNNSDGAYGGSSMGGGLALRGFEARIVGATLNDVVFDGNQASGGTGNERGGQGMGGGLYATYAIVNGNDVQFYNNSARGGNTSGEGRTSDGLQADALGAGASFHDGTTINLQNVIVHNNQATGGNGRLYAGGAFGAGIFVEDSTAKFTDVDLRRNSAKGGQAIHGWRSRGGGAEFIDATVEITNLTAIENRVTGGDGTTGDRGTAAGGGLSVVSSKEPYDARLDLTNAVVAGNSVTLGQGVEISNDAAGGAGLWVQAAESNLEHLTLADNRLLSDNMNGAGILLVEAGQQGANVSLTHCIIANHTNHALYIRPSNTFTLGICLWSDNSGDIDGSINSTWQPLSGDPQFMNSAGHDYRIKRSSEAMDQAIGSTVASDLAGNERDGNPDLGAYEAADNLPTFTVTPTSTPTAPISTVPDETPTPTITSTEIPTETPNPTPLPIDPFENDDTCDLSRELPINESAQDRNFHQIGDNDWINFDLQEGVTYHLIANSTSADALPEMEIYQSCEEASQLLDAIESDEGTLLTFEALSSGRYQARVWNRDGNVAGTDVTYELSLTTEVAGGDIAIIITGHDDGYTLQENIFRAANRAYRAFRSGGIPKNLIRYLGLTYSEGDGDERGDADHDNISDIDTEATVDAVQEAITQWAVQHANSESRVFIYMMDHGLDDYVKLDGDEDQLWADALNGWLNELEEKTGASIAVIYEACLSGSFITGVKTLSKKGRIVITSTDDENNAFPLLNGGAHFSDAFFSALRRDENFYEAFRIGEEASAQTQLHQKPMLDDGGDGEYSRDDGTLACAWKLAGIDPSDCPGPSPIDGTPTPLPTMEPLIHPTPPTEIIEGQGSIQVTVDDSVSVGTIWADIYPPDFEVPQRTTDGTMPIIELDSVIFSDGDGDGVYTGDYDKFTMDGVYRFVIYGKDDETDTIVSAALEVTLDQPGAYIYLPVIQR